MSAVAALGVNADRSSFQTPSEMVNVPLPTTPVPSLNWPAALTTDCAAASELTATE